MPVWLQYGPTIYAGVYFDAIVVVSLLEGLAPRRQRADDLVRTRWVANFGMTFLNSILLRSLFPIASVAWATFCVEHGWGLFNGVSVSPALAAVLAITIMDGVKFAQHYLSHRVPILWRLHRLHHTDHDFDFSTNVRSHPLETVLETVVTMLAILVLGAPPVAVFVFQLASIGLSFADHANVYTPPALERVLRLFVVTPDMHRVHHSRDAHEGRSNLANIFPWWDRAFGTYVEQPADGHDGMVFGVSGFLDRKHLTLPWMLAQPFLCERGQSAAREADSPRLLSEGEELTVLKL